MTSITKIALFPILQIFLVTHGAPKSNTKFIARLCSFSSSEINLFCVGVYFNYYWIIISEACITFIEAEGVIAIFMGSNAMDCESGIRREMNSWMIVKGEGVRVVMLHLSDPYPMQENITVIFPTTEPITGGKCRIYCSFKELDGKQETKSDSTCHTIENEMVRVERCKITQNKKWQCLAKPQNPRLEEDYSPVICKYKLAGFLTVPTTQLVMQPLYHIIDELSDIGNYVTVVKYQGRSCGTRLNCNFCVIQIITSIVLMRRKYRPLNILL
ncbi:hypothetical protein Trydic_g4154 [Trypoxylus dichotomus]